LIDSIYHTLGSDKVLKCIQKPRVTYILQVLYFSLALLFKSIEKLISHKSA